MKALITGISGQDGSYLAEFLLSRGYDVHGIVREHSEDHHSRIAHIQDRISLHRADLLDQLNLIDLLDTVRPDEIYNLAGFTAPGSGWDQPMMTCRLNGLAATHLLDAIHMICPKTKFFLASSSEVFGRPDQSPQNESTSFHPVTPFGIAKLSAHLMTTAYRRKYNLHTCCGILYDHDSPRRNPRYLTRVITTAAAEIKLGLRDRLVLDTLDIQRDWGFAGDYVRAMWMMMQYQTPGDYIIASGKLHSLEDVCRIAFAAVDLDWKDHLQVKSSYTDHGDPYPLVGDTSRARRKLLWEAEISFEEMITMMVESELGCLKPSNRLTTSHPSLREMSV